MAVPSVMGHSEALRNIRESSRDSATNVERNCDRVFLTEVPQVGRRLQTNGVIYHAILLQELT